MATLSNLAKTICSALKNHKNEKTVTCPVTGKIFAVMKTSRGCPYVEAYGTKYYLAPNDRAIIADTDSREMVVVVDPSNSSITHISDYARLRFSTDHHLG